MAKLEIASFNLAAVQIAQSNTADRGELCAEMELGGTSPDVEDIRKAREMLSIPLNVMIRPRGGVFVYTDLEFERMQEEIRHAKTLVVDGFVFGILQQDNTVDVRQNESPVKLAAPLPCTFHMAFDEVSDMAKALEDVI